MLAELEPEQAIGLVVLGLFLMLIVTAIFMVLWNTTVPHIFNVKGIRYWQAFRLLLIAWILFGGFFVRFHWG